jgi:hypothetical protein
MRGDGKGRKEPGGVYIAQIEKCVPPLCEDRSTRGAQEAHASGLSCGGTGGQVAKVSRRLSPFEPSPRGQHPVGVLVDAVRAESSGAEEARRSWVVALNRVRAWLRL